VRFYETELATGLWRTRLVFLPPGHVIVKVLDQRTFRVLVRADD